ncbi:hypothetical protein BXZ70DRAFT_908237 [Cristinia sonorae]|uniref:Uncharacterized protein n=1 Tax=Cristinia sonorae TaxID=1940300 RepID=A0A8K0XP36_9AGAR|nr:hypothetical protein BXZ70DRAFT_908237 [Cristinia sonorae]
MAVPHETAAEFGTRMVKAPSHTNFILNASLHNTTKGYPRAMFGFLKMFRKPMSCAARFDEGLKSGYQQLLPDHSTTEDRQVLPAFTPDDVEFITGLDDLNLSEYGYSSMMVRGMGWAGRQGVGLTGADRKRRMTRVSNWCMIGPLEAHEVNSDGVGNDNSEVA